MCQNEQEKQCYGMRRTPEKQVIFVTLRLVRIPRIHDLPV